MRTNPPAVAGCIPLALVIDLLPAFSCRDFDLLLPDGHFIQMQYDLWLNKTSEPDEVPWEEKEEKVYGR